MISFIVNHLAFAIPLWIAGALLVARAIKLRLENRFDAYNTAARDELAAWKAVHRSHGGSIDPNGYCCDPDGYCSHAYRGTEPYNRLELMWAAPYATMVFGGLLWPLTVPGYILFQVARVVIFGIAPLWIWFFENPRRRKARKPNTAVVGIAKAA